MYKVYFVNFSYFAIETFETLEEAREFAKEKGFEANIFDTKTNQFVSAFKTV